MKEMRDRVSWSGKHCMSYINEFWNDSSTRETQSGRSYRTNSDICIFPVYLGDGCTKSKLHLAQLECVTLEAITFFFRVILRYLA